MYVKQIIFLQVALRVVAHTPIPLVGPREGVELSISLPGTIADLCLGMPSSASGRLSGEPPPLSCSRHSSVFEQTVNTICN